MKLFYNKSIPIALVIFAFALGVRLHYLRLYEGECPLFGNPLPGADPLVYTEWSLKLLRGDLAGIDKPVYTTFCALVRICFADFFYGIGVSQAVLGAVNCVLIYFLGKILMGGRAGIISAMLAAFYSPFVFYTVEILTVTLHSFFFIVISLFIVFAELKRKPIHWFFAGLFIGILALDRGNILFFVPFCVVWLVLRYRCVLRRMVVYVVSLSAGIILLYSVFYLTYFLVEGNLKPRRVPVTLHIYRGNAIGATGKYVDIKELEKIGEDKTTLFALRRQIQREPAAWLRLMLRKAFYTINDYEIPNNVSFEYTRARIPFLRYLLRFGIIAPFGFMGFVVLSRSKVFRLLILLSLSWMLTLTIFFVTSRYRAPAVGILLVSAGCYVTWLSGVFKSSQRRRQLLIKNFVGFAIIFILVNFSVDRSDWVAPHRWGAGYIAAGNFDSAERCFMESIGIAPAVASSYNNLGFVYRKKRLLDESVEYYRKAVALEPGNYLYYKNLGLTYYYFGKKKKALENLRISYEKNPEQPQLKKLFEQR